jgi:uncharacterized protein (TIGR03067 family)
MTRTEVLSLVVVLLVIGPAGRHDGVSAAEKVANAPQTDAERIRGHWVATQVWGNGKSVDTHGSCKFVFTDKEVKFGGIAWEYQLDPGRTPKHLDLLHNDVGAKLPAIYRFDGDKLWLCLLMRDPDKRPDGFDSKPGDWREVYVAERGRPNPTGQPSQIPPGWRLADQKLMKELRTRVSQAAELIEKERYADFFKEFWPPEELTELVKRQKKTLDELAKEPLVGRRVAAMSKLLRATDRKTPATNEAGTWAYYDLRDVHFNGAVGRAAMFLVKADGRWCITEKTPESPRK